MLSATVACMLLLAQSALGGHHDHPNGLIDGCDRCMAKEREVFATIARLQRSPRWQDRDDAAGDLQEYSWRSYPQVVGALAYSLLNDPEAEVREEAAESLAEMAPPLSEAHAALARAATTDRDYATRRQARKGLKELEGKRCALGCSLCDGVPIGPSSGPAPSAMAPAFEETHFPKAVPYSSMSQPYPRSGLPAPVDQDLPSTLAPGMPTSTYPRSETEMSPPPLPRPPVEQSSPFPPGQPDFERVPPIPQPPTPGAADRYDPIPLEGPRESALAPDSDARPSNSGPGPRVRQGSRSRTQPRLFRASIPLVIQPTR